MDRKLVHIETIVDILPHTNADTLEIAQVLGWTCVVLKGQFKKGQQIVFIEPDAILPEGKPEWEFMRARGFRIKTIKLRGVVSQGLVFPLSILPHDEFYDYPQCAYKDGDDVTELLKITKYEPYVPAQLSGIIKGSFPEFLHKTDETRIQAVPVILYRHQQKKFYVTEKVDGSSMTVYYRYNVHSMEGEFGVCSRNLDMKETEDNAFWKTARRLDLEAKLKGVSGGQENVALQGELVGPGVQGNKYGLSELHFFVFNVFNIDKGQHVDYVDFIRIVNLMGLETVPMVTEDYILPTTVDELVEYSKGKSLLNKNVHREGVVFRPLVNVYDEDLHGRLSFKVINPDFLLKYDSE